MKITVQISVGELVDKITILEIKSKISNNEYVIKELNDLNVIFNTINVDISNYVVELKVVNEKLWNIEDRLRQLENEQKFNSEFIELARSVYITNDERARIKREINELTHSNYKEVKIY